VYTAITPKRRDCVYTRPFGTSKKKKNTLMNKILIFLIFLGCGNKISNTSNSENSIWESQFNQIKIEYSNEWEIIKPLIDKTDKTVIGIIDKTDGKSYVIKVTQDVPQEKLSDEDYYEFTRKQMLESHPDNKLIGEKQKQVYNKSFNEMRFEMNTKQWGKLIQHVLIHRTGEKIIGLQISFPYTKELDSNGELPKQLQSLQNGILINEK
jgi:hypothetical protein